MKKNYKDMTRKLFYVFDMVLFGLLLFSIEHTMFRENMIIDTMLDVALILRIIIPFHYCPRKSVNNPLKVL